MSKGKRKRGVTLLELIIALGLLGMITALVFFFFNTNQKTLGNVSVKSDLQYEAKVIIDNFSKYAMEATSSKIDTNTGNVSFDLVTDVGEKVYDGAVFQKDGATLKLTLKDKNNAINEKILSEYVKSFDTIINQEAGSISLDLVLENKGILYVIKENYLFRNKHLN